MWSNAHPRRSQDRLESSSDDDDSSESRLKDATPRPTPASTKFLATSAQSSSSRLGFFAAADKLTSSLSGTHSRADSTLNSAMHTSPSKASYGRTYDPKHVQREMHRLGLSAPQLSSAPSSASLNVPLQSQPQISDPWGALHVHVLPLFNGEPLRIPIEDLNVLVKRHIQSVVSSSPPKALATLDNDTSELIAQGMVTLNAKLKGIEDDKLLPRVVEIWGFFWDQVLTYLEGVLLPLQTDPLLSSLYRTPKPPRPSNTSPDQSPISKSHPAPLPPPSTAMIDVRSLALKSFRDRVILPVSQRLYARLSLLGRERQKQQQAGTESSATYQQPRLQQMLLVLSSQSRYLPPTFSFSLSLSTPAPQPTPGESAIRDLLRLVRSGRPTGPSEWRNTFARGRFGIRSTFGGVGGGVGGRNVNVNVSMDGGDVGQKRDVPPNPVLPTTFLSGGLPRDRRGRIAGKLNVSLGTDLVDPGASGSMSMGVGVGAVDENTPRLGGAPGYGYAGYTQGYEAEREREMLEALRSPDTDTAPGPSTLPRASTGGWGLGLASEDLQGFKGDEYEDEVSDYEQGMGGGGVQAQVQSGPRAF